MAPKRGLHYPKMQEAQKLNEKSHFNIQKANDVVKFLWSIGKFIRKSNITDKHRESARFHIINYNKSEKHKNQIIEYNKSDEHRKIAARIGTTFGFGNPEIQKKIHKIQGSNSHGKAFWENILAKGLLDRNIQFEKQYPIPQEKRDSMGRQRYYFLDFAITNLKIAIECDGKYYHQDLKKDEIRQKYIENLGWTFVRFDNKEIRGNVTKCVNKIEEILKCQN